MGFEKRDSKQYFKTTTIQYILFPVKNVNKKYRENAKVKLYWNYVLKVQLIPLFKHSTDN
jgi:hypothetical protein